METVVARNGNDFYCDVAILNYMLLPSAHDRCVCRPMRAQFEAAFVHSIKQAHEFYRFHAQIVQHLRPLQPPLIADKYKALSMVTGGPVERGNAWFLHNECVASTQSVYSW
jgi:hypothetical protein